MSFSVFKRSPSGVIVALLGLAILPAALQAANVLTVTNAPVGPFLLTCGSAGPGGAATTVSVKATTAPTGTNTDTVTYVSVPGLTVTGGGTGIINSANTPLVYTVVATTGCVGLSPGVNAITLQFKVLPTGGSVANDATSTGAVDASLLAPSVSALTVTCSYDGSSHYVMGLPQTVTVTSPVAGAMASAPLTSALGTHLTTAAVGGGSATSAAVGASPGYSFTVVETTPGSGACPTTPENLVLTSGILTQNIPVTFVSLPWTPLTSSTTAPTLSYTVGATTPTVVPVTISSSSVPNAFFSVNASSLPAWLTVDLTSGAVTGGKVLHFSTTAATNSYNPGSYPAVVHFQVSGYGDYLLTFTLSVSNPPPTLTVEGGTTQSLTWTEGNVAPMATITAMSSGAPIEYTVSTTASTLSPQVASASGLAYSFGTPIQVTFPASIFASAVPGQVLTGNVTLTWGGGKSIVVTLNVTVYTASSVATASTIVPATLPTAAVGQTFTVTMYGTGFVPSAIPSQQTVAGIVNTTSGTVGGIPAGMIGADANVVATVVNSSTIIFSITVPATDPLLNFFAGAAKAVTFGVCDPNGTLCASPTGTQTVTISSGPTFTMSQVVSSATFAAPAHMTPYDILTIFGSNFCNSNGTGCTAGQVLLGVPTGAYPAYPSFLTPDAIGTGSTPRNLAVTFTNAASSPTATVNAPLLFATNTQINFLVPSVISSWTNAYITINFGVSGSMQSSSVVGPFVVGTSDAGIFAVNADGTGDGAILDTNYNLIGNTNPAVIKASTGSGTVQIYGTGLGAPSAGSITTYLNGLASGPPTMDGLLILNGAAPVLSANPSVYIGNATAISSGLVTYSGWVADSVAGLYQVNAKLPANSGSTSYTDAAGQAHATGVLAPMQLGLKIGASQSGVSMWVVPELNVTAPAPLSGGTGATWTGSTLMTADGTSPRTFSVPAFMLPASMVIDATGAITAAPSATGYYVVTGSATDAATPAVSGSTNFLVNVTGGGALTLGVTLDANSLPLIRPSVFGIANGSVTTVTPSSGTAAYTFTIAPSGLAAAGIAIDGTGLVSTSAATPAGVYEVVVTVTDSLSATNTISFPLTVLPALNNSGGESLTGTASTNQNLTTISATTGNASSAITYSTTNAHSITVNSATGVVHVPNTVGAGTYYVDITATDATAPSGTGITSANAAGGSSTIYVAVKLQ